MKELNEVVTQKIAAMINDGTIENIISRNVEMAVTEGIRGALRSYGKFGQMIERKIEESLQCVESEIELPAYNQFISQVVRDKFTQVLEENAVSHLAVLIEETIKPVMKEAKISELLAEIEELWGDVAREKGKDEITITTEKNAEGTALYVTIEEPQWGDMIRVSFYNFKKSDDKWHIGYINERGERITGRSSNVAKTALNKGTDLLFRYYAMGTRFEMDEEIESIYVRD